MDTLKDIYIFLMQVDLMKAFEHVQALGLSALIAIGSAVVIATVLAKICDLLIAYIDNKEIDGKLGVIAEKLRKVAAFGIDILHLFPSWSDSPKAALLKKRIDELQSMDQKQEDPKP